MDVRTSREKVHSVSRLPGQLSRKVLFLVLCLAVLVSLVSPVEAQSTETSQEERGIIESGSYESPQFSNTVTWSEDWILDDPGLQTDDALLLDRLSLLYKNYGTAVIMFIEAGGETPEDYARRLIRYRHVTEADARVVWSDSDNDSSSLLYLSRAGGREVSSLIEIQLVDDDLTLQVVELLVYPEYADTVFEHVQSDIEIDGGTPFGFVTEFPKIDPNP